MLLETICKVYDPCLKYCVFSKKTHVFKHCMWLIVLHFFFMFCFDVMATVLLKFYDYSLFYNYWG